MAIWLEGHQSPAIVGALKHDGSRHHLLGIQPSHPVERTIRAVEQGREEDLEKSIALRKGK